MYERMMKRKTQERKKSKVLKKQITEKSLRPEGLGPVSTDRTGLSLNLRERNEGWSWIQKSLKVGEPRRCGVSYTFSFNEV